MQMLAETLETAVFGSDKDFGTYILDRRDRPFGYCWLGMYHDDLKEAKSCVFESQEDCLGC